MQFETFYDTIKKNGNSSFITIPYKLMKFTGMKNGDKIKIMIQKK